MSLLLDSFWRAAAYCLHPRVIALSFLPLALMGVLSLGLGYLYWGAALNWVRDVLDGSGVLTGFWAWLEGTGLGGLKTLLVPLIVLFAVTPLVGLLSVVVVAILMTPALVRLVTERRFPELVRKKGGSMAASLAWSLGSMLLALVALAVSMPLWLIPPLAIVLPPLIWGWLTYRVMSFDALAEHASRDERHEIFRRHRGALLVIGIMSGYMGAILGLLWASGALFALAFFLLLVPLAIWLQTLVLAFSSLWFTHFGLAALARLRLERADRAPFEPHPVASHDGITGSDPASPA